MTNGISSRVQRADSSEVRLASISHLHHVMLVIGLAVSAGGCDSKMTRSNDDNLIDTQSSRPARMDSQYAREDSATISTECSIDSSPALWWDGRTVPPLSWQALAEEANRVRHSHDASEPQRQRALYVLGRAQLMQAPHRNQLGPAVAHLLEYLESSPNDYDAHYYTALALLRARRTSSMSLEIVKAADGVLEKCLDVLKRSPFRRDSARRHLLLSYVAEIDGRADDAATNRLLAIREWPEWSYARFLNAYALYENGEIPLALSECEFVASHMSADVFFPVAYVLYSACLMDQGRFVEAESVLQMATAIFPDSVELRALLFGYYSSRERAGPALIAAHQWSRVAPNDPSAALAMVTYYLHQMRFSDARSAYAAANTTSRDSTGELVADLSFRVSVAAMMNDIAYVEHVLEKHGFDALEIGAQHLVMLLYVSDESNRARRVLQANELLQNARVPMPSHAGYWFLEAVHAIVYASNGKTQDALQVIDRALASGANNVSDDAKRRLKLLRRRIARHTIPVWNVTKGESQIMWWPPILHLGADRTQGLRLRMASE